MSIFVVPSQIGCSKEVVDHRRVRFRLGRVGDYPQARSCRHSALSFSFKGTYTAYDNDEMPWDLTDESLQARFVVPLE